MKNLLFVGHSHIKCLHQAFEAMAEPPMQAGFLFVRDEEFKKPDSPPEPPHKPENIDARRFGEAFVKLLPGVGAVVMCFNGNEHNNSGMVRRRGTELDEGAVITRIHNAAVERTPAWHRFLARLAPAGLPFLMLPPPPPIFDGRHLAEAKGRLIDMDGFEIVDADQRMRFYEVQMAALREAAARLGLPLLELPASISSADGFLLEDCMSHDPSHGNVVYGTRVLASLIATGLDDLGADAAPAADEAPAAAPPSGNPYAGLPDHAYWKQSISNVAPADVFPMVEPAWRIDAGDMVATAGSCFAQHISRRLRREGFNYLNAEPGPADEALAAGRGFQDFSARYGNVYTARQLVQLFDRAFGYFRPSDRAWQRRDGRWCDPLRPRVEPNGFATREDVLRDTRDHLVAVRGMFRALDVFVFTLGLTECWVSRLDGTAFPVAPGVAAGEYDTRRHAFVNFGVSEVVADMDGFVRKLQLVNPRARIVLTVSPVPLVATYEERHVLVSTIASKSILRAAADEITRRHGHVVYFPSYEIITGPQAGGAYFEADRRSVTEAGVEHVMRVFMESMTEVDAADPELAADEALFAQMEALGEIACEEEMLAKA